MNINIYRIVHPDTNDIVYVGQTIDPLWRRLSCHLSGSNNKRFLHWSSELKQKGMRPKIELIEKAGSQSRANQREQYWINKYRMLGIDLFNSRSKRPHQNAETSMSKSHNGKYPLRILSDDTRQNLADELARRKITRPELSINRLINDLIETALATSHTEVTNAN